MYHVLTEQSIQNIEFELKYILKDIMIKKIDYLNWPVNFKLTEKIYNKLKQKLYLTKYQYILKN